MKKLITLTLVAMAISGSALAQSSDSTNAMDAMFNDKAMMARFYSDDGMTTMKSGDDFMAAVRDMSETDRNAIAAACKNVNTMRQTFCDAFNMAMQGM